MTDIWAVPIAAPLLCCVALEQQTQSLSKGTAEAIV